MTKRREKMNREVVVGMEEAMKAKVTEAEDDVVIGEEVHMIKRQGHSTKTEECD